MYEKRGGVPVSIIVFFLIGFGAIATIGSAMLLSNSKTTAPENSLAAPIDKTPKPNSTPDPNRNKPTDIVKRESGTTANGWTFSGFRDVLVDVVNNSVSNEVIIEFSRSDFSNIASIYYNFKYLDKSVNIERAVESTIAPENETIIKTETGYVIRKRVYLGACSKNVCTPYSDVSSFQLSVVVKRNSETKTYEQLLSKNTL